MSKKQKFKTEVSKLLDIVINSLYSENIFSARTDFQRQRCVRQAALLFADETGSYQK